MEENTLINYIYLKNIEKKESQSIIELNPLISDSNKNRQKLLCHTHLFESKSKFDYPFYSE
jgi:hypothetical protein